MMFGRYRKKGGRQIVVVDNIIGNTVYFHNPRTGKFYQWCKKHFNSVYEKPVVLRQPEGLSPDVMVLVKEMREDRKETSADVIALIDNADRRTEKLLDNADKRTETLLKGMFSGFDTIGIALEKTGRGTRGELILDLLLFEAKRKNMSLKMLRNSIKKDTRLLGLSKEVLDDVEKRLDEKIKAGKR